MRISTRWRRRVLAGVVATAVVAQLGLSGNLATAAETPLWQVEVAKIPTAKYTRDAKVYVAEATQALRPYVGDGLGDRRIDPVLADVDARYFDGARLKSAADGEVVYDNLQHLESFLKSRMTGASPPNGEAEQAHVRALVETLTGVRLLAEAAIQDAEATIGPFRATPPPAPAPDGLAEAFANLDAAKVNLAKADEMLLKANPVPATIQAADAWRNGLQVLTRLGITYDGDHDADGVVDVVELRFGSSPLLVDSDGDQLTDKFEIFELAGWTRPNAADTDADGIADGAEDIDGDGLTNLDEQRLGTSPTEPDTDGDGLNDGAEVARGTDPLVADQPRTPPERGDLPPIVTAPSDADTDGDGLTDLVEGDEESNPANPDTDGDGLSDGDEVNEHLISPLKQDSDGDGLRDDYEISHALDQGLDPGRPDQQVSKWTYVTDFLLGMFAGDFAPRDSMAWLSGYLCSGGLSVIPVVGWIVGGIADIRDAIAAVIHVDWVGAGLSILGLIPYVGDAAAIPAKVARFVRRFTHRLAEVTRFVARYDKIPDSVKTLTIRAVLLGDYDTLISKGFTDATLIRYARGDRTNLKRLAEAMSDAGHGPGPAVPPQFNRVAGENYVRDTILSGKPETQVEKWMIPENGPRSYRAYDFNEDTPAGTVGHEVKTGVPDYGNELSQCERDGKILASRNRAEGPIAGIHWHFLPHGRFESIGPSQAILDCLRRHRITWTIYPPTH